MREQPQHIFFIQCCVGSLQGNGVGIIEAGLLVIVYDFFLVEATSDRYERCPLDAGCFSVAMFGVSLICECCEAAIQLGRDHAVDDRSGEHHSRHHPGLCTCPLYCLLSSCTFYAKHTPGPSPGLLATLFVSRSVEGEGSN